MVLRDVDHRWVSTVYAFLLFFVAITLSRIGELCVFRDNNNFLGKKFAWKLNGDCLESCIYKLCVSSFSVIMICSFERSKNVWNRIVHSLCFFLFQWRSNNFFLTFQN